MFIAPIDHVNNFQTSLSQHINQQSGNVGGDLIPNTGNRTPVGTAPTIRTMYPPRITKNLVKHSLAGMLK